MPLRLDVRLCARAGIELARVASEERNLDPPLLKDRIIGFIDSVKPPSGDSDELFGHATRHEFIRTVVGS